MLLGLLITSLLTSPPPCDCKARGRELIYEGIEEFWILANAENTDQAVSIGNRIAKPLQKRGLRLSKKAGSVTPSRMAVLFSVGCVEEICSFQLSVFRTAWTGIPGKYLPFTVSIYQDTRAAPQKNIVATAKVMIDSFLEDWDRNSRKELALGFFESGRASNYAA
jgi:hypothetical protein